MSFSRRIAIPYMKTESSPVSSNTSKLFPIENAGCISRKMLHWLTIWVKQKIDVRKVMPSYAKKVNWANFVLFSVEIQFSEMTL